MKPQKVKFDKLRPVYFGFNAFAEFEELTGIGFADIGEKMQKMSAKDVIAFVFSGLIGGAKKEKIPYDDITLDEVANWLDDIDDLEKIFEIYVSCMPMVSKEQEKKIAPKTTKKK